MAYMSIKCALWLNYDNDKARYQCPVNPEKIKLKVNGKVTASDIDKLGTLLHKGKREAITVSWSSFFPSIYSASYCACAENEFKSAKLMHKWILELMEAEKPLHFVLSGGPFHLNMYAVITGYTAEEVGGDPGSIQYTIELKEYRSVTITKYTKKKQVSTSSSAKKNETVKKSNTKKRVSNAKKSKNYTVKSGDCLWNIAKRYYGNGASYTKILSANRSKLDQAAKKHGYANCSNGNLIFPGTVIRIP